MSWRTQLCVFTIQLPLQVVAECYWALFCYGMVELALALRIIPQTPTLDSISVFCCSMFQSFVAGSRWAFVVLKRVLLFLLPFVAAVVVIVCLLRQSSLSSSKASWKGKKPQCHLLFQQIVLFMLEPLIRSPFTLWKGCENVAVVVAIVCLLRQLSLSSFKVSWKS